MAIAVRRETEPAQMNGVPPTDVFFSGEDRKGKLNLRQLLVRSLLIFQFPHVLLIEMQG